MTLRSIRGEYMCTSVDGMFANISSHSSLTEKGELDEVMGVGVIMVVT